MSIRLMSVRFHLAPFIVAAVLMPAAGRAMDDDLRAASKGPTNITLCGDGNGAAVKTAVCKAKGYDTLVAANETAFQAAVAKAPAEIRPLLKRDEVWFNEMILQAGTTVEEVDEAELRDRFVTTLRQRASALDGIARGFGRGGLSGRWTNAFGSVTLTSGTSGGWRLAIDLSTDYGSDKRGQCRLDVSLQPSGGWLSGALPPADGASAKPPAIKLRRQGDSLRLVVSDGGDYGWERDGCDALWQVTGSYFANGTADTADKTETVFVVPTFDCTRPESATDEEICADPELADNDQRLNRAWKALPPRLDDVTRRALTQDQRDWVKTQTMEFPEFLHPAWEKRTSAMHYTASARDHVHGLQRERIALLDGFDEKRTGLAGVWLANDSVLKVTIDRDGKLTAKGWKWEQGDWKAGCEYDMTGKIVAGVFRSEGRRKNPDTLERDHAMLIVNRLDDAFARKRTADDTDDEPKCRRRLDNSSTARLFPARPSADIDNLPGSIR